MAAHYNLATTFGVTLPGGAVAQSAEKTTTVDVSEVVGASGEIVNADPLKVGKVDITVSGQGPAGLSAVVTGVIGTAVVSVIETEQTESNKGRAGFSIKAAAHQSFADNGGAAGSADGVVDIDTIEVVSVSYACVESVKRSVSVSDLVLLGSDGTPCDRARSKKVGSYTVQGRGDIPAGFVLGSNGADVAGFAGGKLIQTSLKEMEKAGDWNGFEGSGRWYPAAA